MNQTVLRMADIGHSAHEAPSLCHREKSVT
jgi:hypothetical protein